MVETTTEPISNVDEQLEQLAHIRKCERALQRCWRDEKEAKAEYIAAQNNTKAAQERLNRASGPDEELELFESASGAVDKDAWRKLAISELGAHGVAEGTLALMAKTEILTLGDYQAYCNSHLEGPRAISGIGQGKADGIADAWLKFFGAHEEYCQPEDDAKTEGGEDDGEEGGGSDAD